MHSNTEKTLHGNSALSTLDTVLSFCKEKGYISNYVSNFRIGYPEYSPTQFYAPYLLEFHGGEKWIVFSTTSMRSDRIKGQQWDTHNIKVLDPTISKCLLVYPDHLPEKEKNEFHRQRDKIRDKKEYSVIDDIIDQNMLFTGIERTYFTTLSRGTANDLRGKAFETRVANILSYPDNLEKWKTENAIISELHYDIFLTIIQKLGVSKERILSISATADEKAIGRLPSGGKPKTDVLVCVNYSDGTSSQHTISCKTTNQKTVSVHQYTCTSFSNVLDPANAHLASLLTKFQECGNLRDFGAEKGEELFNALIPYREKLAHWVLGGIYGEGDPKTQWAEFLLTYDDSDRSVNIHTISEYCDLLSEHGIVGHFGTFFHWTYASGQKGKSIQLKCKVIK